MILMKSLNLLILKKEEIEKLNDKEKIELICEKINFLYQLWLLTFFILLIAFLIIDYNFNEIKEILNSYFIVIQPQTFTFN